MISSMLPSTRLPRRARVVFFAFLVAGSLPTLGQNLVQNPGFETGNLTDWTLTRAAQGSDISTFGGRGHSGTYAEGFGAVSTYFDSISQNLPTIAGAPYNLTFWLENPYGENPTTFEALWNGTVVFSIVNPSSFPYTEESFPGLVATGASTPLVFEGLDVPAFIYLDDVSVVLASTPPPPAL